MRQIHAEMLLYKFHLAIGVIIHLPRDIMRQKKICQTFLKIHTLTERREHARNVSRIQRIAGRVIEPVVKYAGYRSDYGNFEMTAEGKVARCRERLRILSINPLIIRVQ